MTALSGIVADALAPRQIVSLSWVAASAVLPRGGTQSKTIGHEVGFHVMHTLQCCIRETRQTCCYAAEMYLDHILSLTSGLEMPT